MEIYLFQHGLGFYSEMERINSSFSYSHNTTGLMISRISYFSSGYGPYAQFNSYYRGVFENVNISDSIYLNDTTMISTGLLDTNGLPLFDKYYCSSDLHLKYKTRLFNKNLYLFSLINYNTAQDFFSVFPVLNSNAFIRSFNHQLDMCYEITDKLTFVLKHANERVKCNKFTDVDDKDPYPTDQNWGVTDEYVPSMKPRDQYGNIFGAGVDIKLNTGTYLF